MMQISVKNICELHKISIRFHNSGLLYKVKYLEHFKFEIHFLSVSKKESLENEKRWRKASERTSETVGWWNSLRKYFVRTKLLSLAWYKNYMTYISAYMNSIKIFYDLNTIIHV